MRFYFFVLGMAMIFSSCVKEEGAMNQITSFSVTQNGSRLTFEYSSTVDALQYYEVIYSLAPFSLADANNGAANTKVLSGTTSTIQEIGVDIQGITNSLLTFYIRAYAADGTITAWSDPVNITIEEFCPKPTNIMATFPSLIWQQSSFASAPANQYEVEYSTTGFTQGTGTVVVSNDPYVDFNTLNLTSGVSYDYYVRSYCANNVGWGEWAGPFTRLHP